MPTKWPYADMIEVERMKWGTEKVSVARWRSDADRSAGFSEEPHFLFAMDRHYIDEPEKNFTTFGSIFYGPYPRASAVLSSTFEPIPSLVHSLAVPLLIVFPQNVLNFDRGASLLELMRSMPDLRAHVHTGSFSTVEFFEGKPEVSRIEFRPVPLDVHEFHGKMAQMYGFALPQWFLQIGHRSTGPGEGHSVSEDG